MSLRSVPVLAVVGLSLLLVAGALVAGALGADSPSAPNWRAKCADGSRVEFRDVLADGPVVVSFWATWCKPCLREMPHLDALQKELGDRVTILAVNVDETRSVNKVRPLLKSKGWDLRVPLDTSGDIRRRLQVGSAVPYLVVYDTDGREAYRHQGYKDGDEKELERAVRELLAAGDPQE